MTEKQVHIAKRAGRGIAYVAGGVTGILLAYAVLKGFTNFMEKNLASPGHTKSVRKSVSADVDPDQNDTPLFIGS